MKTLRKQFWQQGPSNNCDEHGDPIPPKYKTSYEIQDEWGFWKPISNEAAQQLLAAGKAVLL